MSVSGKIAKTLAAAGLIATVSLPAMAGELGLGRVATPEEVASWDIDIRPDGQGLPDGSGNIEDGEAAYLERCAHCHGDFAEGAGRYPVLMGGIGSLATEDPVKTIGSYWPYASTVYDYIYRAMPFGEAQTMTPDETYGITAYLLYLNEVVDEDFVADKNTLPAVKMPNEDGFFIRKEPEFAAYEPCMKDCKGEVKILGRARNIDVTPEDDESPAVSVD